MAKTYTTVTDAVADLEATGEWERIAQSEFVAGNDCVFFDQRDMRWRYATRGLPRTDEDILAGRSTSIAYVCMRRTRVCSTGWAGSCWPGRCHRRCCYDHANP